MVNRWNLTNEQKEKFIPILKEYFDRLENMTDEDVDKICATSKDNSEFELDLTYESIGPYLLRDLLIENFGYEEVDFGNSGWEMDLWIYIKRKDGKTFPSMCENMVIQGCGMTYSLALIPYEFQ